MQTIGRAAAVSDLGWVRFSRYFAWLIWLFVHLINLVAFGNRVLVLLQWAGNYFTRNRAVRLITGESPLPLHTVGPGSSESRKCKTATFSYSIYVNGADEHEEIT